MPREINKLFALKSISTHFKWPEEKSINAPSPNINGAKKNPVTASGKKPSVSKPRLAKDFRSMNFLNKKTINKEMINEIKTVSHKKSVFNILLMSSFEILFREATIIIPATEAAPTMQPTYTKTNINTRSQPDDINGFLETTSCILLIYSFDTFTKYIIINKKSNNHITNRMFQSYNFTVAERFMRYVQIDTQSDPQSNTFPSTEKQKDLSKLLVNELLQMGTQDAHVDENGYVYATVFSNTEKKVPVICFCAHVDTAPDCTGKNVKPIVHKNYDGKDIILPDDPLQIISSNDHPYLKEKIGEDIITASGTTLLGADDKAGVAVIMDFVQFLKTHPEIKHGDIKILFTPDEEIGRGVDKIDLKKLGADFRIYFRCWRVRRL